MIHLKKKVKNEEYVFVITILLKWMKMVNIKTISRIILFLLFTGQLNSEAKEVLLLNSYHQRMTWVQDLLRGIEDIFNPEADRISLKIENMDTKVYFSEEYYEEYSRYLTVKYTDTDFSLLMCSDNNAFNFLVKIRNRVFPGVPIIFCGVNDFKADMIADQNSITGVAEIFSAKETVDLLLDVHENTEEIFIINDYLTTGKAWANDIARDLEGIPDNIKITHSENKPIAELKQDIAALKDGTIILLGVYFADSLNYHTTYEKIGAELAESSPIPVYCLLGFNIGPGIIGGNVISGYYQGRSMAEMALQILEGADPDSIPVDLSGSNQFIFNYEELKRFGISDKQLPDDSLIINLPDTLLRRYKREVNLIIIFFIILTIVIIFLVFNNKKLHAVEKELNTVRKYLENIIDSMPSVMIGVNDLLIVTMWNTKAEQISGTLMKKAMGEHLRDVYPLLKRDLDKITESIKSHKIIRELKYERLIDDNIHYENLTIYPLNLDGIYSAVVRIDDVTEQVKLEEVIVQSEKMLSVGGLAAGMAHEINNPLGGMIQSAGVLYKRLGDNINMPANQKAAEESGISVDKISEFVNKRGILRLLESINESGRQAADIVQNMLSFSRNEQLRISPGNLEEIFDRTLELASTDYNLRKHYDFKNIRIIKEVEENLPVVFCKTSKIQQVLLNLLRNGAEAMSEAQVEKPQFIIRLYSLKENLKVCIEIEDNGPGMIEEVRKRIFEPFYTTKPVGIGTGLGLSISYFIITENHSGEMLVESSPGRGANFIIRLPL